MTVNGVVTEFRIPTTTPPTADDPQGTADPRFIEAGSDGNLWFTELLANKIGRITPAGVITEFPVPTTVPPAPFPTLIGTPPAALSNPLGSSEPRGLILGPDGNIWFTEFLGDKIGRITPAGVLTEFQIPTPGVHPFAITGGPNGDIYFSENTAGKIGVMNTDGVFLGEITLPTPHSGPISVVPGIGNTLIVAESASNKLAQISLGAGSQTTLSTATLVGQTTAGATVTLLNTGATTTADAVTGQYQFTGVPLSPGANIFSVQASDGVNQSVGSDRITRIAATTPVVSADLVSNISSGNATGVTTDPAVSGQISSNSAVLGVSNGIVSFMAGFDRTPTSKFVDVSASLNIDGSFNLDDAVINQIAKGKLAKGVHTLHLRATDIFGNIGTFNLSFRLK
jgi:hypothetical protein